MEISTIIPHIEALIFASDKPLAATEITEYVNNALGFIEDRASQEQVASAIDGIKEKYDSEFYAFELKQSGGGWQFLTKPEYHKTVALINGDKFIKKLSIAALETLAIIAYKQPITKSEIESIRGVNCDYAVQKLLEKDLVIISGRNEDAVGKPLIYNTSKSFMDYFGINSADDLPKIREVLMDEFIRATSVSDLMEENSESQEEPIILETAEGTISGEIIEDEMMETADNEIEETDTIEQNTQEENSETQEEPIILETAEGTISGEIIEDEMMETADNEIEETDTIEQNAREEMDHSKEEKKEEEQA